jgi:hypothetical protein
MVPIPGNSSTERHRSRALATLAVRPMKLRASSATGVLLAVPLLAVAAPHENTCPKEDEPFQPFLKRFAEDPKFRSSRTVYPLVVRFGDVRLAPPTVDIWGEGTVDALRYPLILSQARLKKEGLERTVTVSTNDCRRPSSCNLDDRDCRNHFDWRCLRLRSTESP